ncbi:hypothetical protein LEP3755_33990 [Leptolyngbya sp. NIES-3755]|nr:hypothetical protein LEP3755_33990 [Leptolyngbya sp. NIES-3755]
MVILLDRFLSVECYVHDAEQLLSLERCEGQLWIDGWLSLSSSIKDETDAQVQAVVDRVSAIDVELDRLANLSIVAKIPD